MALGVIIEELNQNVIGKRLGQNLYNPTGNLLLRKGVEISPRYFEFFVGRGYRSIFLLSNEPDRGLSSVHYNSDKLLATAPYLLKRVFRKLKLEESVNAAQARGELLSLAESILVHVRNTLRVPPKIMELKRAEDYLYQHSVNVAVHSILIGQKLDFHDKKLLTLAISALLHDFGMMFVDDAIVNKTTRLEEAEFEQVKEHTTKGFTHLVRNCFFDGMITIASVQHHERYDGHGYPKSLEGESIHEYSRIIALTDFFDAWTSDRPHRRLNSVEHAMEFIRANQSTIFDPTLAARFVETFG
ncbi:HD domain-containing protein [candidate division KSB1 bacterium]|nr:HD domain-containing protein [candidate division KSB1 bacterium]